MRCWLPALASVVLLVAAPASAEFYSWTDEAGRTHFTQNLSEVPARYRLKALEQAEKPARRDAVQTFSPPPVRRSPGPASPAGAAAGAATGPVHRIHVDRAGTSMLVSVRLNNSVTAPFVIDTGASDVVIPQSVAEQLGLDLGPDARTKLYSTANGVVQQPVVMLDSVKLGGAEARKVPASVSRSMSMGLLGLSFFNRFTYNIDAAAGVVTLQPNGLEASGGIRGGRSEAQWRSEYANLHGRIAAVDQELGHTPEHHTREIRRLEALRGDFERQLELLDAEADQARVPFTWRR